MSSPKKTQYLNVNSNNLNSSTSFKNSNFVLRAHVWRRFRIDTFCRKLWHNRLENTCNLAFITKIYFCGTNDKQSLIFRINRIIRLNHKRNFNCYLVPYIHVFMIYHSIAMQITDWNWEIEQIMSNVDCSTVEKRFMEYMNVLGI